MIQISELIKDAMHQKDRDRLNVLKLIKTEFLKKQTEAGRKTKELSEEEQIKILLKMVAQREDSIAQYIKGGRQDLADAEKKELEIINTFVPKQPTEEELTLFVEKTIVEYISNKENGFKLSMSDMKPILEIVKQTYPTVNGKIVSQTLKNKIVN